MTKVSPHRRFISVWRYSVLPHNVLVVGKRSGRFWSAELYCWIDDAHRYPPKKPQQPAKIVRMR